MSQTNEEWGRSVNRRRFFHRVAAAAVTAVVTVYAPRLARESLQGLEPARTVAGDMRAVLEQLVEQLVNYRDEHGRRVFVRLRVLDSAGSRPDTSAEP